MSVSKRTLELEVIDQRLLLRQRDAYPLPLGRTLVGVHAILLRCGLLAGFDRVLLVVRHFQLVGFALDAAEALHCGHGDGDLVGE